jgi:hypothetical protein
MSKPNGIHVSGTLNATEALFGFMGWLTSRKKRSGPFSGSQGASEAVDLITAFMKANNLDPVREGWNKVLKHPD